MTHTAWRALVLSKIDPVKVRLIVKYELLEHEPWKSQITSHILPEAFELEVDKICRDVFGLTFSSSDIVYLTR